jgi:hypothetical protein
LIIYFFQNVSNFENSVIYVKAAQVLWYSYNFENMLNLLVSKLQIWCSESIKNPLLGIKNSKLGVKKPGCKGLLILGRKGENLFKPNEIFFEARGRIKVWPLWYFYRSYQKYFWRDKRDIHKVRKTQHQYPSISY